MRPLVPSLDARTISGTFSKRIVKSSMAKDSSELAWFNVLPNPILRLAKLAMAPVVCGMARTKTRKV